MKTQAILSAILLLSVPLSANELYRLRIQNAPDGTIEASADQGRSWHLIGRVRKPATSTAPGFSALAHATQGTVAASAVHGLRIKVGLEGWRDSTRPELLSIEPAEWQNVGRGFGGYYSGNAGIHTDIRTGESLFRGLAPTVGSLVTRLQVSDPPASTGSALPTTYQPKIGDVLLIRVPAPSEDAPREIIFENKAGGQVLATNAQGAVRQIAQVRIPLKGVGRFDATGFNGVGSINTNHSGVITVSTAPNTGLKDERSGKEPRGGFQILPDYHARTVAMPQVLVVGPVERNGSHRLPILEGTPPLFSGLIPLDFEKDRQSVSAFMEMRVDNGSWEPLPAITGVVSDAFTAQGLSRIFARMKRPRQVRQGLTHLRLKLPLRTPQQMAARIESESRRYQARRTADLLRQGIRPVRGVVTLSAEVAGPGVQFVQFLINQQVRGTTNVQPYEFRWDTLEQGDGEHIVEVRGLDERGGLVYQKRMRVLVQNQADRRAKSTKF